MSELFHTALYQPIFNLLIFLYNIIPFKDMGIAIILLTIIIRAALWPLSKKQIDAQKKIKDLQPKIDEVNKKHKEDPQKRAQELMKIYKENNANPASSCLPLLVQLPILWAVFRVFQDGFVPEALANLYSFVSKPEVVNPYFLRINFFDLSQTNIVLTLLTAVVQFWQSKMLMIQKPAIQSKESADENMQAKINKQMVYIMPVVTVIIGIQLPSGLMLYWLVSTLLMGLQQVWMMKKDKAPLCSNP